LEKTSKKENDNQQLSSELSPQLSQTTTSTSIKVIKHENNNTRIWVLSKANKWRECAIVGENEQKTQFLVHYITFNPIFDEWIDKNGQRIKYERRLDEIEVDDNVSVYSLELQLWVEAEIVQIDKDKNRIKVAFVGFDKEEWIDIQSPRISLIHQEPDEPYNGTDTKKIDNKKNNSNKNNANNIDNNNNENKNKNSSFNTKTPLETTAATSTTMTTNNDNNKNDNIEETVHQHQANPACCQNCIIL